MTDSSSPSATHVRIKKPAWFHRRMIVHLVALCLLMAAIWLDFGMAQALPLDHTRPSVDAGCQQATFSPDGNPFPLCPGPYPGGGNCVWWAWEQWHLLGYNLPLNWGNAAEWIVDAERFGLQVGTTPRLGSIAVFPVADGVWAFGAAGHVAFVTWVSPDASTFNVTYQNYGDPTPMYIGHGYNVDYINQPRFQNGALRFIYFPALINAGLFAQLPGVESSGVAEVASANARVVQTSGKLSAQLTPGLSPGAGDQIFDTDFTGSGYTDLLLYNRQQGRLDVLTFADRYKQLLPHFVASDGQRLPLIETVVPQRVGLGDSLTPAGHWGSNLDIRIGDFDGDGRADILLYDRVTGEIQLLSLNKDLTIRRHVILPGWGPGWEVYTGRFDGQNTDLLLYNPAVGIIPQTLTPTPGATPTVLPSSPRPTPSPTHKPSPGPTPSPTPTPSPSPSPTPGVTPTPSPSPSPSPSPTPTPSPTPSPQPTPSPTPTVTPTATPDVTPTPSPTGTASAGQQGVSFTQRSGLPLSAPAPGGDLSGEPGAGTLPAGVPPNVLLVSFKKDFRINVTQSYTLLAGSWEFYTGRFVNANQDGLFLFDRITGEARIMDFTRRLRVNHYQELHALSGNWEIHTGDFSGSGRAQVLLYDPGSGATRFLTFGANLAPAPPAPAITLQSGAVFYVGHFGLPALSVMLYNPSAGQSTFVAFNNTLKVALQYTAPSWNRHWQVLVGAFLDHSACSGAQNCQSDDDLLLLNRDTGQVQQFSFTFGNHQGSRSQQDAIAARCPQVNVVEPPSHVLGITLDAGITDEELY